VSKNKPQRTAPAAAPAPAPDPAPAPAPQGEVQPPASEGREQAAPAAPAPAPKAGRYIDIVNDAGRKRQCVEADFPTFAKRGFRRLKE